MTKQEISGVTISRVRIANRPAVTRWQVMSSVRNVLAGVIVVGALLFVFYHPLLFHYSTVPPWD